LCPDPPLEQEETLLDDGIEVDDSEDEDCFMVTGDIDADKGSDEEGPDEEDAGILDVEETSVVWTIAMTRLRSASEPRTPAPVE